MEQRAHTPSSDATPPCKVYDTQHFNAWREHLTALKSEVYRRRKRLAKSTTAHQTFSQIVVHAPSGWSRGRRSTSFSCGGASTCIFSEQQEAHRGSVTQEAPLALLGGRPDRVARLRRTASGKRCNSKPHLFGLRQLQCRRASKRSEHQQIYHRPLEKHTPD